MRDLICSPLCAQFTRLWIDGALRRKTADAIDPDPRTHIVGATLAQSHAPRIRSLTTPMSG
ncbi:hypothetical protein ACFC1I_20965 [Microbacterium sp. NPDC056044]|uniref:hypothetical protein n=1 Tax=Microbacterium sp. NPDC056044 TaxID=3345690 RepID=UPI0035E31582